MTDLLSRLWGLIGSPLAQLASAAATAGALGWWAGGAHEHRAGFKAGVTFCEARMEAAASDARHRHRDIIEEARDAVDQSERGVVGADDLERLCAGDPACPDR